MNEDSEDINLSDIIEKGKLFEDAINSLDKKLKDKMDSMNIKESRKHYLKQTDPHYSFNADIIDMLKDQRLENMTLEQREKKAIKDINQLDKALERLNRKLIKLKEDKSADIEGLHITNKILSKAIKKYSTNFKINISRTEQPSDDTFISQVTFFFNRDSKTVDFTINRKERKIIDVNTQMFEELECIKDKLITEEGLNIPLFIKTLK